MSGLERLVVKHFGPELDVALRAAFQEVTGSPLPANAIIEVDSTPHRLSPEPAFPRGAEPVAPHPPVPGPQGPGMERPRGGGGSLGGKPDAKAEVPGA